MSKFSITRRIEIDMAHRIPDHKSKCFNLHGHRYVIEATCVGDVFDDGEQTGMVMDFGFLKDCMMEAIHEPCDHGAALCHDDPLFNPFTLAGEVGWKVYRMTEVPTAENLAKEWYLGLGEAIDRWFRANRIGESPPKLEYLDVWETPNCRARYPL